MNSLYVWKEEMQRLYARYAKYIDKVLQLILGILVVGMINSTLGYRELAASKYVTADSVLYIFAISVYGGGSSSFDFAAFVFVVNGSVCCNGSRVFDDVYFLFSIRTGDGDYFVADTSGICIKSSVYYPGCLWVDRNSGLCCTGCMWDNCLFYVAFCIVISDCI